MFQKLSQKLQAFMIGRNGIDNLGRFSLGIAFVFLLAGMFVQDPFARQITTVLSFAFIMYCYYRMLSKKIGNRYKENCTYVSIRTKVTRPFRGYIARAKEWQTYHKTHKIYHCKKCGQSLRVPKGKGTVKVTCPKCKNTFTAKS